MGVRARLEAEPAAVREQDLGPREPPVLAPPARGDQMPATIELEQPAPRAARRVGDQRARAPGRDRRVRILERGGEPGDPFGIEGDDVGAREPGAQPGQRGAVQ
jgi:hypothetical protein